jgi:hypothetical protein
MPWDINSDPAPVPKRKLHHDWLPWYDEANQVQRKYYLPKPHEIYEIARQLREQRTMLNDTSPGQNSYVVVPVRKRPFS